MDAFNHNLANRQDAASDPKHWVIHPDSWPDEIFWSSIVMSSDSSTHSFAIVRITDGVVLVDGLNRQNSDLNGDLLLPRLNYTQFLQIVTSIDCQVAVFYPNFSQ